MADDLSVAQEAWNVVAGMLGLMQKPKMLSSKETFAPETRRTQFAPTAPPEVTPDMIRHGGGSIKGPGWLGPIPTLDGRHTMTELSIGVDWGRGEQEIPLLVPGLTRSEVDLLAGGSKPTGSMVRRAVQHADKRMKEGLSPFRSHKERQHEIKPDPEPQYIPGGSQELAPSPYMSDDPGGLAGKLEAWKRQGWRK